MGKLLKLGNPKVHPVLTFLHNIHNPNGLYPGILDFSLDKDNLYISEDNIRSELWKYSDEYNIKIKDNIRNLINNKKITRETIQNTAINLGDHESNSQIVYLVNMWNRYKQIYKINSEIESNFEFNKDFKLLFNIFDKLPFDAFFIEYTDNKKDSLIKHNYSIIGTFVCYIHDIDTAFNDGYRYKSKERLLDFCDLFINKDTGIPIVSYYHIKDDETDGKYITDIIKTYLMPHKDDSIADSVLLSKNKYVELKKYILSYILQSILYLCSDDITTTLNEQATIVKSNMSKIKNKNITISEIGYNIPEEDILIKEDVDRRNRKIYKEHEFTGRINKPHWRKAHWHYYWCGKGKTELRLKFLLPILVNGDKVNEKITTIVRNKTLDI